MSLGQRLLAGSGLAWLARLLLARRARFVVELHGVPNADCLRLPAALRPGMIWDDLEEIVAWLAARFRFLTPEEFLAGRTPGVLLTFDDGFANQARIPFILERFQAPAIVFVTTQHVQDPKNWLHFVGQRLEEVAAGASEPDAHKALLREMFDGMSEDALRSLAAHPLVTVGGHTMSHPLLTGCDDETLRRELEESRHYLQQVTGRDVDFFAYPSGDYDSRVAQAVESAGYRAAFVEDSHGLGLDRYEIPRVGLYRSDLGYLSAKFSGLHRRPLALVEGKPEQYER